MRFMRGLVGVAPVLVLLAVQQFMSQTPAKKESAPAQKAAPAQSAVERGKYLVTLGGCNDCHTPKTFQIDIDRACNWSRAGGRGGY